MRWIYQLSRALVSLIELLQHTAPIVETHKVVVVRSLLRVLKWTAILSLYFGITALFVTRYWNAFIGRVGLLADEFGWNTKSYFFTRSRSSFRLLLDSLTSAIIVSTFEPNFDICRSGDRNSADKVWYSAAEPVQAISNFPGEKTYEDYIAYGASCDCRYLDESWPHVRMDREA